MSVPHRPAHYAHATSHANPVTGALDQAWASALLTLRPAKKFHGFPDIERLVSLRQGVVQGQDQPPGPGDQRRDHRGQRRLAARSARLPAAAVV